MSYHARAPPHHPSHTPAPGPSYQSHRASFSAPPPPASRASYHPQQHGRSMSYAAPPGADPTLWQWFAAVDTDRSGSISLPELQQALFNGNMHKFDLDTIKMLMNMFDVDRSGTITFNEFAGLWKYVGDWQKVFHFYDSDRSGSIEGHELSAALRSFGFQLSPRIIRLVETKYANGVADGRGVQPGINFDRFVRACVVVKQLTEAFQRMDADNDGWIQVAYEDFMAVILGMP